ncbi:MAG: LLM class F420-dependent oxidoreductase [Acidimicrobiales bacterium]
MKVDGGIGADLAKAGAAAKRAEAQGYDGAWAAETAHDPFFPLVLAAEHTTSLELGTGIAVAFARNPMILANIGWDLQSYSGGRFMLGLGSQIRPHIEKRFSMPWSHPAPRMREFVLAMRAIWAAWQDRTPLKFEGEFYTHKIMTPFFDPGPSEYGSPRVFLAAVGELMTEVCGEVCDGMLVHGFTTERYLREVTIPALDRGLAKAGRTRTDLELSCPIFIVTGETEQQQTTALEGVKRQIAFYGSTPAYRPVLELHGWGDLQPELNRMSKDGKWVEMGGLIDDDVVDAFAVVAPPDKVPEAVRARFGDVVDRLSFYTPYQADDEAIRAVLAGFKA